MVALTQLLLLCAAPQALGSDFLSPFKIDQSKLTPVVLPAALSRSPAVLARQVQENVAKTVANREQTAEGWKDRLDSMQLQRQGSEWQARAQQAAAQTLGSGAAAVARAQPQGLHQALEAAAGGSVTGRVVAERLADLDLDRLTEPGGATALRGATAEVASAVNASSQRGAELLTALGPRAAALVRRTGYDVAGRLAGRGDHAASSEAVLPFDLLPAEAPERSWYAFCGAAALLVLASCGALWTHRWQDANARKGPIMLSEALAPLAEASARAPTFQAPAGALLG